METKLKSEFIHKNPNAPVVVVFCGNPEMRDRVVGMLEEFNKVTVFATLSEEEGMKRLKILPKVNFVLIGGRYNEEQRVRIRKYLKENRPEAFTSEPGIDYPYGNEGVRNDMNKKLNLI
jgi:uncharacterized pyridoxamine 5'-phosphate oxidase family protein